MGKAKKGYKNINRKVCIFRHRTGQMFISDTILLEKNRFVAVNCNAGVVANRGR